VAHKRQAGRIVAEVLDALEAAARPGLTTLELDRLAAQLTEARGGRAAFKGYHGFPASLCVSLNHEVVHGIPSAQRRLAEGDLLKLDFGAVYRGLYADAARTVAVGRVSAEAARLLETAREALWKGIGAMVPGQRVGDIGHAVQRHVEGRGFSVVRDFTGHGIGRQLHEEPRVPNHGAPGSGPRLRPGMALAVEPMVNAGTDEVYLLDDDWTAVTADGRLSAHFEHTILVTERGPEVLTRPG
jgi:methionyl aminopeptidase